MEGAHTIRRLTVMRLTGSYSNMAFIRSTPAGSRRGKSCWYVRIWMRVVGG